MKQISILLPLFFFAFLSSCQRELDLPVTPAQSGKVTFWAKNACSSRGSLVFSINNITDSIISFVTAEPSCESPGTKTIELPVGSYNWKAICASDTLTGVVVIDIDQCKLVDLTFPDPPSMGNVTFWAKKSCSPEGRLVFSIDNITDSVISFSAAEPTCGAIGVKTLTLPVGTYSWKAFCSSDTLAGIVTIDKDQCKRIDITFPDLPVTDTEYIKFKDKCDTLGFSNGVLVSVNESGTFTFPPFSVLESDFSNNLTSIQVFGSYNGEPENWYGVYFTGPASAEGTHIVNQLKLPGMVVGMSDTLKVNITRYGKVGEFIEGNLKGKIRDDFYNRVFDVEMEFSMKRRK